LQETEGLVQTFKLGESIPFLLWNDLFNKHTLNGSDYDEYTVKNPAGTGPKRYDTGRKVFVDFGYGVDRELFQPHPAIVLGDFNEMIVVVPTNSEEGDEVFSSEIKKAIVSVPSDATGVKGHFPIFPKDTLINLHQIRHVSKNRVQKDLKCNAKNYIVPNHVIDQINTHLPYPILQYGDHLYRVLMVKLAHIYSPDTLHVIKRLQSQIASLSAQVTTLSAKLEAFINEAATAQENSDLS